MGFVNIRNICWNSGTFFRLLTAPDMVSMPNIRVANPRKIMPVSFFLPSFMNM